MTAVSWVKSWPFSISRVHDLQEAAPAAPPRPSCLVSVVRSNNTPVVSLAHVHTLYIYLCRSRARECSRGLNVCACVFVCWSCVGSRARAFRAKYIIYPPLVGFMWFAMKNDGTVEHECILYRYASESKPWYMENVEHPTNTRGLPSMVPPVRSKIGRENVREPTSGANLSY